MAQWVKVLAVQTRYWNFKFYVKMFGTFRINYFMQSEKF